MARRLGGGGVVSGGAYVVRSADSPGAVHSEGFVVSLEGTPGHVLGPYATSREAANVAHRLNNEGNGRAGVEHALEDERRKLRAASSPSDLERREREARVALDEATAKALRAIALIDEAHGAELAALRERVDLLEHAVRANSERLRQSNHLHSVRVDT